MKKGEKFFVFEYPMQRFGCFIMNINSFNQYKKDVPRFENQLQQRGISCRQLSDMVFILQYSK
jgi:hypothetical protein